jgi:hypothetical protein
MRVCACSTAILFFWLEIEGIISEFVLGSLQRVHEGCGSDRQATCPARHIYIISLLSLIIYQSQMSLRESNFECSFKVYYLSLGQKKYCYHVRIGTHESGMHSRSKFRSTPASFRQANLRSTRAPSQGTKRYLRSGLYPFGTHRFATGPGMVGDRHLRYRCSEMGSINSNVLHKE